MAKRFTKPSIDWAALDKLVPPEQRHKYLTFKGKADGYLRRVNENPPEPPKIDWEMYKKTVPVAGLVDKFKGEYEKLKVPFPNDTLTAAVDKQWESLQGEIKKFCAERQKEIDLGNKELQRINALPKFEDMTMEMYAEMHPDEAIDFVKKQSFWPHDEAEQLDYEEPGSKKAKDEKKKKKDCKC